MTSDFLLFQARYQHLDSTPPMMPNKVIDLEVTPPDSAQKHIRRPNPLDYILKSVNGRSSDFLRRRSFQAVQNSECSPVPVSPMEVDSSAVLVKFPLFIIYVILLFHSSVKFILFVL